MDLKEKVKELPSCPGVYLMKDSLDNIIYVGKSKNLKSRVGSYFQDSKAHPPKVVKLVKNLKDFDYMLTDTEFEALMLECKLIRQIKPFYNRLLKNPNAYSYISISYDEKYPTVEISEEAGQSGRNLYFGPYTNKNTVEKALQGIKECCRILCPGGSRKTSPCLNYSLDLCIGVCLDSTPKEQYLAIIDKIAGLLGGTDKSIIEAMEDNMKNASEKLDFESAAKYRDYISAVNCLVGKSNVVEYTKGNKNIVVLEHIGSNNIKVFLIKGNRVLFSEKFGVKDYDLDNIKSILKADILTYFNRKPLANPVEIGRGEIDESQIIYSYLNSKASSSRHVIIQEKWLTASNGKKLDKALDKLFFVQK
ncbi:MAG TPA: UvrB/UvrC motif-containing protein [Clostridia bacterium]|nr:UvrB/UvrC motif-containing protein [Clostridia bacterium]